MKKRISCIFYSVLFALTAFGCTASDANVSFDDENPWYLYEKCEYDVKKYVGSYSESNTDVIASGTYTATLTTSGDTASVTNKLTFTYADNAPRTTDESGKYVLNAGLTDVVEGAVTFNRSGLVPITASKSYDLAQRPLCDDADGMPYALQKSANLLLPNAVKYSDPRGYSYTADYSANTAHVTTDASTTAKNDDGTYTRAYTKKETDIALKSHTRFDNEQLNYVIRALSNCKLKGSATFYLTNLYDSYVRGSYTRHTMTLSCKEKPQKATFVPAPSEFKLSNTEGELAVGDDGKYVVSCIDASVSISADTSGPSISFLITDPGVTIAKRGEEDKTSNKVIVQMIYTEYSMQSAKVGYQTVYTLSGYSFNRT